jgi:hypothetical protein
LKLIDDFPGRGGIAVQQVDSGHRQQLGGHHDDVSISGIKCATSPISADPVR